MRLTHIIFAAAIAVAIGGEDAAAQQTGVSERQLTFPTGSKTSETLAFFGAGSSSWSYQAKLVTPDGPFTSASGFCTFNGTLTPTTGPSFSVAVINNGSSGQWTVYVTGGFGKRPSGDTEGAHIGYVTCHRW